MHSNWNCFFYHLYSAKPLILVVGLWASTHPLTADAYLCSERREILWFIFQWILCRAKNCRKIHRYASGCAHIFACVWASLFRRWRWNFFSFELCSSRWNVCYSVAPIARFAIGSLFHANGSNNDDDDDIEVWFSDERNSFRFSAKEKMFLFLSFLTSSIYSVAGSTPASVVYHGAARSNFDGRKLLCVAIATRDGWQHPLDKNNNLFSLSFI